MSLPSEEVTHPLLPLSAARDHQIGRAVIAVALSSVDYMAVVAQGSFLNSASVASDSIAMKIAVCAAALLTVASAATCDYAVVGPNLQSLGKPIASCMTATGNSYNLARAPAPPTPEQAAAICSKCSEFVAAVTALPPWPDCTMNVGGSEQTLTSYFDKMIGGCKPGGAKETPAAKTGGSGSTGGEQVTAPANNSTGAAAGTVTTAPSNASSPVPSPKSAGYSVRVGALAASAFATTMAIVF
jgi:hypothetical protein